jgi:hypothetical protein
VAECLRVGSVLIDTDRERQAAMLRPHQLLKEPFRRGNVAFGAEHKLDRISLLVHGAVEIFTRLPDFDVGLVDTEGCAAHLQMRPDTLIDFGRVSLDPSEHGRVIHIESTLFHHLFNVAVGELVAAVPADTK